MSVHARTIVLFGIKLDYDEDIVEKLEEYEEKAKERINEVVAFSDGMCGKYIMLGYLIAVSNEYCMFEEPVELSKLSCEYIFSASSKICDILNLDSVNAELIIFTHYT